MHVDSVMRPLQRDLGTFTWHKENASRQLFQSHAPMSRVLIFPRSSILYIHPSLLGHRDSNPLGGCQECVKMFSATILLLLGLTFFLPAVSQCVLLSRASYAYCPVLPSPYHCQSTATLHRGSTRNCQKNPESSRRSSNLY